MSLKSKSELEDNAYIELNISGTIDQYHELDELSYYLEEFIFGVFSHCFERSHSKFDYYGATCYPSDMLTNLKGELHTNLSELNKVSTFLEFNGQLEKTSFGISYIIDLLDKIENLKDKWEDHLEELKHINQQLIILAERCENEKRVLWILNN